LWIPAAVLLAVVAVLYGPWVHSPKIFDDITLYTPRGLAHAATVPFDGLPRTFPYFTLALLEVLLPDGVLPNRLSGIVLHGLTALALYCVGVRLFSMFAPIETDDRARRVTVAAGALALLFAVHPVAVYGAGYLAQRTIVLATLFSLLSILWLLKALGPDSRRGSIVIAALFYWAAVFSKEHAITLAPAAVLALLVLTWRPAPAGRASDIHAVLAAPAGRLVAYLALCAPAAVLVFHARHAVVGTTYEPFVASTLAQLRDIPIMGLPQGAWLLSALVQSATFFEYVRAWLWPHPGLMSIDLRVDFVQWWSSGRLLLAAPLFGTVAVGALVALRARSASWRVAALSVAMLVGLYVPEFLSVRFQEPFVLYRSYLWGPWILLVPAVFLLHLRVRTACVVVGLVAAGLLGGATNRLASMSSERAVWEDAAAKLPSTSVPGAARVYYNRGLSRARAQELDLAQTDFQRALEADPDDYHGHFGLGLLSARRGEHAAAIALLDRAQAIRPDHPAVKMERAAVLVKLGRVDEAADVYRQLAQQGDVIAKMFLDRLAQPTGASGQVPAIPPSGAAH
jgi:hypothetical protein